MHKILGKSQGVWQTTLMLSHFLQSTGSMENSQHRQVMNVLSFAARWFGVWSFFDDASTIKRIIYMAYSIFMTSMMWIFVGTLFADLLSNLDSLLIISDDGCFLVGVSVIVFKHAMYHINRKEIIKLIEDVYRPIDYLAKSSNNGVLKLIKSTTIRAQIQMYSFCVLGSILVLVILTFVPRENGSLPIRAQYPFNTTEGLKHTIAFAIQATALATAIIAILFMDSVVLCFILFIIPQLQLLDSNYQHCRLKWPRGTVCSSIKEIKNPETTINCFVPFSPAEAHETNDSFEKRFKICIKHHHRLARTVDYINFVYGSTILCQLLASSTMICLTGFQVALGASSVAILIKFALYCGTAFSQLFSWCFVGNSLLHQSLELGDAPWFSGWEDEKFTDVAYLLIVSTQRGQKAMELRAVNFLTISLETFIMILRASYSFFALLTAVTEN